MAARTPAPLAAREALLVVDEFDDVHPPSTAELERVERVIAGDVVATELQGGRRLRDAHSGSPSKTTPLR